MQTGDIVVSGALVVIASSETPQVSQVSRQFFFSQRLLLHWALIPAPLQAGERSLQLLAELEAETDELSTDWLAAFMHVLQVLGQRYWNSSFWQLALWEQT